MPPITVFGTDISIQNNLYSLNDLHKAAGSDKKHQPSNFLRVDQTKDLIAEIQSSDMRNAVQIQKGGNHQGTFVCKELVYAYAMWISPKFNLAVIRAFDSFITEQYQAKPESVALPNPDTREGYISIPVADWFEICNVIHTISTAHGDAISHCIATGYSALPKNLPVPFNIGSRASRAMGMIHGLTFAQMTAATH